MGRLEHCATVYAKAMTAIHKSDIVNIIFDQIATSEGTIGTGTVIEGSTHLVKDLGFSSVEFVVIFEKIQNLCKKRINFIDLIMPNRSTYVDDLSVDQIYQFLNNSPHFEKDQSYSDPYANARNIIQKEDIELLNQAIRHQTYPQEQVNTSIQYCFLLSAPRSGSTLLRRMLACHPEIYAPMELHLLSYLDFHQRQEELNDQDHKHLLEGTIVARQEIRGMKRSISEAIDRMYARDRRPISQFFREIETHLKQKVFIDKTPTYAFSINTIERIKQIFPQAKFIHLKRKPNAVIKSMIDSELGQLIRFRKTSGIDPKSFAEALWCLCEHNIRAGLRDVHAQTIHVNYESLVTDPEKTMLELHEFLELTKSTSINPYSNQGNFSNERAEQFAGDLKTYLRKSIDPSVANEWERFDSLKWLSPPTQDLLSLSD